MFRKFIRKAVIPAAGLGTRLLPFTKEQPKEMLPVFHTDENGKLCIIPLLQLIFEQLYEIGIRDFYFIIGRTKRSVEDHFTSDHTFINYLLSKNKNNHGSALSSFYRKIENSSIHWINQHEPQGFGHAVLLTKHMIEDESFIVCAGDTYIFSKRGNRINDLIAKYNNTDCDAAILIKQVPDPTNYGVVQIKDYKKISEVTMAVEKPARPMTNMAIMPIYIFNHVIFDALTQVKPKDGEIQLTDGIQKMIDWGYKVIAVPLTKQDQRLDIGRPETYWEALRISYNNCSNYNGGLTVRRAQRYMLGVAATWEKSKEKL